MMHLIPLEERKYKRCHYCNTWVSVKYKVDAKELDRVYYNATGYVNCCNRCVTQHYIGNKENLGGDENERCN